MSLETVVWALTGVAALSIVLTRVRVGRASSSGGQHVGSGVLNLHTVFGVLAVVGWVVYLVGSDDLVGVVALAFWWLTALAGLLLLLRWLPSRGRHAQPSGGRTWTGPALSVLAHLGLLACVLVFTWFYASR